jgi:hypothetical protein
MAGYEDAQSKLYPQRLKHTITHVLRHFRREKFAEFVPEVFSLESGEYLSESVIVDSVRNGSIYSALFAIILAKLIWMTQQLAIIFQYAHC